MIYIMVMCALKGNPGNYYSHNNNNCEQYMHIIFLIKQDFDNPEAARC